MDLTSRLSWGLQSVQFSDIRVPPLFFFNDVIHEALTACQFWCALEPFAAGCDVVGMRSSTSKSMFEATALFPYPVRPHLNCDHSKKLAYDRPYKELWHTIFLGRVYCLEIVKLIFNRNPQEKHNNAETLKNSPFIVTEDDHCLLLRNIQPTLSQMLLLHCYVDWLEDKYVEYSLLSVISLHHCVRAGERSACTHYLPAIWEKNTLTCLSFLTSVMRCLCGPKTRVWRWMFLAKGRRRRTEIVTELL